MATFTVSAIGNPSGGLKYTVHLSDNDPHEAGFIYSDLRVARDVCADLNKDNMTMNDLRRKALKAGVDQIDGLLELVSDIADHESASFDALSGKDKAGETGFVIECTISEFERALAGLSEIWHCLHKIIKES